MRGTHKKPGEGAAPLTLGDLTKAKGLVRAAKALNASPADMVRINSIARKFVKEDPTLSDLNIGKSSGSDFYDIKKDRVAIRSSDPDILAHEIGHAARLRSKGNTYKHVLRGTKALNSLLTSAALPLGGAASYSSSLKDEHRSTVLKGLAAASALSAIPNMTEEVLASASALRHSTDKIRTLTSLAPGLASHALHDLGGTGTYLLFNQLANKDK
tara:strand:+ start:2321 stop:2962 length:642 start_codon:yes stop_codon:yes gene_type:complete